MKVAIASGKGGTGKTTVSAALTSVWNRPVVAVDLDVEAPNLHLFLKPHIVGQEKAHMEVPVADESKCTFCRACADLCQFKAISVLGSVLLTFTEMCPFVLRKPCRRASGSLERYDGAQPAVQGF